MKPSFLDRIRYWLKGEREREELEPFDFDAWMATTHVSVPTPEYDALVADAEKWRGAEEDAVGVAYLAHFGPNVPVEDLGGKPVGMEKAP